MVRTCRLLTAPANGKNISLSARRWSSRTVVGGSTQRYEAVMQAWGRGLNPKRWLVVRASADNGDTLKASDAQEGGPLPLVSNTVDENGNPPPTKTPWVKFCCNCGGPLHQAIPPGEDMWRSVCTACGRVDYQNPKMVAGCVVMHHSQVLMCRRGIEPCKGLWTLPAGYVELGESVIDGAKRETWEEALAKVQNVAPYFHLDIPRIGQAYIIYRAELAPPFTFGEGPETLEAQFFSLDEIPFEHMAFSSMTIVLKQLIEDMKQGSFQVHQGKIHKKDGFSPSDPLGYELRDHIAIPTSQPTERDGS